MRPPQVFQCRQTAYLSLSRPCSWPGTVSGGSARGLCRLVEIVDRLLELLLFFVGLWADVALGVGLWSWMQSPFCLVTGPGKR